MVTRKAIAAMLTAAWFVSAAAAAAPGQTSARTQVKLAYGVNDVKLDKMSLRIVRGVVGNGTASSFDTYTVYVLPVKAGDPWMQVTSSTPDGLAYNLRNYESGDANTEAIGFYLAGGHLYAVQASKVGPEADARGARKTPFDFDILRFNENGDIPMFDSDGTSRSKGRYVDGTEALEREFFRR